VRGVLLALIVLLSAPASAAAQEPLCKVTGPEARTEAMLRREMRVRGHYGFRADRAYVAKLIAQGPAHRRHGIRVTPAEDRYLDRREKVGLGAKAAAYLRRRPAITDFWEVRDDWPRGAYVAVFVTDDPARHRAAIKRLASRPQSTRVVRVRYSAQYKDRIDKRIQRDVEALEREGFEVLETETDWGVERIDISLVTRRSDHARYFERRYGSVVKTHATRSHTFPACVDAASYEIAPDGMSLTVRWEDAAKKPARIELTQLADRVAIGVVERLSVYPGFGGDSGSAVVRLRAPLGGRPVYDAYNGSRMLQTGPSPGDPPCPVRPERTPLEGLILEREQYGMNTDPAHVQSLLDAGLRFTPDEERWLEDYRRFESTSEVNGYLQGGRERKDWGGTTTVARYPDPPYLIVRLLRNQAFHQRQIRRIAKVPVRFETSTVQRDWFYTLPLYIGDDARPFDDFLDGYGRDGFYIARAEGDEGAQTVDVYVITTRADADAYFKGRYGGIVRVHVIGDRFECRGGYSFQ